ncbi:MAG: MFS transporter, partial [Candidatus Hadarchaeum sp.]
MRNWKINLAAAWIAQFLSIAGFSVAFPFLPFYIRELGVTEVHQVELWTGLLNSVAALSMALISPFWGVLADRYGRKLMVERATFGGAIILAAMAFAGNVQQLFVLRIIQGMLTGTVPAFMTLTACMAPPTQAGFALGLMQMAVFSGSFVGPML